MNRLVNTMAVAVLGAGLSGAAMAGEGQTLTDDEAFALNKAFELLACVNQEIDVYAMNIELGKVPAPQTITEEMQLFDGMIDACEEEVGVSAPPSTIIGELEKKYGEDLPEVIDNSRAALPALEY